MFYSNMKGVADRLLTEYGSQAVIKSMVGGVLQDVETCKAIRTAVEFNKVPETLIDRVSTGLTLLSGSYIPTTDDYVTYDGTDYKILLVTEIKPTNLSIVVKILVGI